MFAAILGGVSLSLTRTPWLATPGFLLAALCIQTRLMANMLDGMVAMESGRASKAGEMYNEVPDRVSDAVLCIGAGHALGGLSVLGWLAAVVAIFVAYVRVQGRVAGAPQDYCGPMAKPQRMFVLTLACLYCSLAPGAWQPSVFGGGPIAGALLLIVVGGLGTAFRRLGRIQRALQVLESRSGDTGGAVEGVKS
jgi:phosphatidylglycerophosphate synthase